MSARLRASPPRCPAAREARCWRRNPAARASAPWGRDKAPPEIACLPLGAASVAALARRLAQVLFRDLVKYAFLVGAVGGWRRRLPHMPRPLLHAHLIDQRLSAYAVPFWARSFQYWHHPGWPELPLSNGSGRRSSARPRRRLGPVRAVRWSIPIRRGASVRGPDGAPRWSIHIGYVRHQRLMAFRRVV